MSQMSQIVTSEGNTSPRSRKWIFVLHNYTALDITNVTKTFLQNGWKYLFSEETGSEGETPHLQGYIENKNAIRFDTLKKLLPRAHLEKARGNLQSQIVYITKEKGKYYTNITFPFKEEPKKTINELYAWQKKYYDLLKTEPENRIIYWIYDEEGNKGKTEFCRLLFREKKAMWIRTAKASDIKMLLLEHKNCRDIIFDLPRDDKNISYSLLEELKDGFLFSGKYEGGMKEISIPHILVMANYHPDLTKLSNGRIIVDILN